MEVFGLEARHNDLARGIVVVRCRTKLLADQQRELWNMLAVGGVTEPVDSDEPATLAGSLHHDASAAEDDPRELMAAPWMPPSTSELVAQRQALDHAAAKFEIVAAWFLKVETGVDSTAWIHDDGDDDDDDTDDDDTDDDVSDDASGEGSDDSDDDDDTDDDSSEAVHRIEIAPRSTLQDVVVAPLIVPAASRELGELGEPAQPRASTEPGAGDSIRILFRAPDAPDEPPTLWSEASSDPMALDDMADDDDDGDDGDIELIESRWRSGVPPLEYTVSFPLERYPDILDNYDAEDFGIAIKLSGHPVAGEDAVINALFALWLSAYQDERSETFEPFRRADVVHDRTHRSALLWVERLRVPATAADQVHFLMWIVARLAEITPIMWARFDTADEADKAKASADDNKPFVLAGNPFEDRLQRQGQEAALAWAVSQSVWTKRELAGMLIEVALARDPNEAVGAALAEMLLRRALQWDELSNARGYLAIVLIRQRRFAEAFAVAMATTDEDVRLLTVIETAQVDYDTLLETPNAPSGTVTPLLQLLDPATMDASSDENLTELIAETAKHADALLAEVLPLLPARTSLIPHLYNASFGLERTTSLAILRRIIQLPPPPPGNSESRAAYAMAWNNACIHAHALGDYETAAEIAEGGLPYGDENPYMFHSAACAFAALGNSDRALELLTLAISANYDHIEKMETDPDLAPLFKDPRFTALFKDWRDHRADLN